MFDNVFYCSRPLGAPAWSFGSSRRPDKQRPEPEPFTWIQWLRLPGRPAEVTRDPMAPRRRRVRERTQAVFLNGEARR